MQFNVETISQFNKSCDTNLTENMTFSEAIDDIEKCGNNYFYVSMNKQDVIDAINGNIELIKQLQLDLVLIKELGIFIALQP